MLELPADQAERGVLGHDANRPAFAVTGGSAWVAPGDGSDNYAPALLPDLLEAVLALSDNDRTSLAEYLIASLPADPQWLAELECRARGFAPITVTTGAIGGQLFHFTARP